MRALLNKLLDETGMTANLAFLFLVFSCKCPRQIILCQLRWNIICPGPAAASDGAKHCWLPQE